MGTHPIFESDFDCLTEMSDFKTDKKCRIHVAVLGEDGEMLIFKMKTDCRFIKLMSAYCKRKQIYDDIIFAYEDSPVLIDEKPENRQMKDENTIYHMFAFTYALTDKVIDPLHEVSDCQEDCHAGC